MIFSDSIKHCTGNHSHTLSAWPRLDLCVCATLSFIRRAFSCVLCSYALIHDRLMLKRTPSCPMRSIRLPIPGEQSRESTAGISNFSVSKMSQGDRWKMVKVNVWWLWYGSQTDAVLEGITRHGLICFICCYTWTWSAMWIPEGGLKSFVFFHVPLN